jgi:ketosteroid isomerase-like protein
MTGADPNAVQLVLSYVEASQRARASGDPADFAKLREYLAEDLVIKQASAWTDSPWRVIHEGREMLLARLQAPANAAAVLHTETVNAVAAGDEVLVEQVSRITTPAGEHVSAVCFMFTVSGGKITAGRLYRNDANLPV